MESLEDLEPIYFLGWIIQPTSRGYFVYDRLDHYRGASLSFATAREAYHFIDRAVHKDGGD